MRGFYLDENGTKKAVRILTEELHDSSEYDKEIEQKLKRLNEIYAKIPTTTCDNCGECCRILTISIFSIEFINIERYLDKNISREEKERITKETKINNQIVEMYKESAKKAPSHFPCSFRDEQTKKCMIYPVRPFDCQMFGLKGRRSDIEYCVRNCRTRCENVKIADKEKWDCSQVHIFAEEIKKLSDYFIASNSKKEYLFNLQPMEFWLNLKYIGVKETLASSLFNSVSSNT